MKHKRFFSILVPAGVSLALNIGFTWSQTTPEKRQTEIKNGEGERTGEQKMEARGTQEPGRMEMKKGEEEMEARGAQKPGRMGRTGAEGTESKDSAAESWTKQDISKAQAALKNQGHDPGSIDGVIGPQTQQAIRAFQNASGLKETGRLDAETAKKLGVQKESSSSTAK
jgi:murein L,D-transpeptidase YcbB/YkuD